ncbi:MucB/RseB C-terminal domain-containing protein [Glaciecola sp. MH2013]|nr:MucB/RseB C-terminal domain-containing protein [Glaciecola sp. MH2013]
MLISALQVGSTSQDLPQAVEASPELQVSEGQTTVNDSANDTVEKAVSPTTSASQQSLVDEVARQVLQAPNGFNPNSAESWLKRLARTIKSSSYEASFVLNVPGKDTQPFLWRHAVLEDGQHIEQLSSLNGPGFENVRIDNVISLFQPGYPPYSIYGDAIDGPIPVTLLNAPEQLFQSYQFILVGRNRVAGRAAQQIRISSKDKTRYGYHIWLDEETGMLLKLNMYGLKGEMLQQIQVTQLRVDERIAEFFAQLQAETLPPVLNVKMPPQRKHQWYLAFKPVGMKVVKQDVHQLPVTGQVVEYLLLSDGLVNVSVYVKADTGLFQEDVNLSNGANSVHSRANGRVQVTVVGDVPLVTAQKIAESIEVLPQSVE